ncbi:hypothetical protein D6C98_09612 [Aureobasidium pullulans]|uniref:DUF1996 domain-containing protein n=3 Tax=Aureobasidium pullulans TaxID=5580 RepID=A0A074XLL5_AURPU|nr:uncharacterized protein M438DRAFT_292899 [Aureobasidium pullulans EXF-150]THW11060.1 hypothetical protein D6D24_07470 [Aureobasidium pullulans]KEQ86420.1 hypothetical protein M438DRAFT_292899 [Aureobasidium pullulans EXF-150]THX91871.1 hypothetical protein D6D03_10647 [Aureobasidium pullulans]THY40502.1 hypothetical protein D6C98_09612 [Aureobasidium pullulans]THY87901.1 hypothetical protein D6C93_07406 [Aureobasidium pullulans]
MVNNKASALSLAVSALTLAGSADAFWRLPCRGRTGVGRLDPIMDPGEVSDHVHVIHGGNKFGIDNTPQDLASSDCTSCAVTQDKSAYWTPPIYFLHSNGTAEMVEQVGGMLAYYLLYTDSANPNGKITAFPEGFQMISGDKRQRSFPYPIPDNDKSSWTADQKTQSALSQKALGFNCLNYAATPEASLYRHFLPDKDYLDANCLDGIRLELMFPSCWNGKDVDSDDHKSHVAFPDLVMSGACPEGFGTKLPSLFFETIFNTYAFKGMDGQFVLSNGDPTGYGYHGDFQMGWDSVDFLQSAVDTCTNASGEIEDCALFNIQSEADQGQCTFAEVDAIKDDNPLGPREDGLPIAVPIQSGPSYATNYPVVLAGDETQAAATSTKASSKATTSAASASAVVPTLSYTPGTSSVTDKYGGGILLAETASSYVQSPTAVVSVSASTVTAAASLADAETDAAGNIIATSWYTSGNQVMEMMIEEVDVTVTATAVETANAHARRHVGKEHRRVRGHPRR